MKKSSDMYQQFSRMLYDKITEGQPESTAGKSRSYVSALAFPANWCSSGECKASALLQESGRSEWDLRQEHSKHMAMLNSMSHRKHPESIHMHAHRIHEALVTRPQRAAAHANMLARRKAKSSSRRLMQPMDIFSPTPVINTAQSAAAQSDSSSKGIVDNALKEKDQSISGGNAGEATFDARQKEYQDNIHDHYTELHKSESDWYKSQNQGWKNFNIQMGFMPQSWVSTLYTTSALTFAEAVKSILYSLELVFTDASGKRVSTEAGIEAMKNLKDGKIAQAVDEIWQDFNHKLAVMVGCGSWCTPSQLDSSSNDYIPNNGRGWAIQGAEACRIAGTQCNRAMTEYYQAADIYTPAAVAYEKELAKIIPLATKKVIELDLLAKHDLYLTFDQGAFDSLAHNPRSPFTVASSASHEESHASGYSFKTNAHYGPFVSVSASHSQDQSSYDHGKADMYFGCKAYQRFPLQAVADPKDCGTVQQCDWKAKFSAFLSVAAGTISDSKVAKVGEVSTGTPVCGFFPNSPFRNGAPAYGPSGFLGGLPTEVAICAQPKVNIGTDVDTATHFQSQTSGSLNVGIGMFGGGGSFNAHSSKDVKDNSKAYMTFENTSPVPVILGVTYSLTEAAKCGSTSGR